MIPSHYNGLHVRTAIKLQKHSLGFKHFDRESASKNQGVLCEFEEGSLTDQDFAS